MEPQSKPASAVQDLIDPAPNSATAITVAATAFGLLAVFLINLISGAVPLRLLDQQWHLRVIRQAQVEQASQWRNNQRQFIALQQAIVQATTMNDLQARMQAHDGPVFAVQDQALPLERVRQQLLQALALAWANNRNTLASLPQDQVFAQLINTVQIFCTSLAMALSFAAGARRPGSRRRNASGPANSKGN